MKISYFLGANTKCGFYSFYDGFASNEGDYLHIIKGGPGTGKSSFMRRIGKYAEELGFDVQYVLCSGDPDSLDGVYIPAIKTGWVDGTSPHPAEPRHFGSDSDYIDLGRFCKTPLSAHDSNYVNSLTEEYKSFYSHAYALLLSAEQLRTAYISDFFKDAEIAVISKRISGILDRRATALKPGFPLPKQLFISALSCRGMLHLSSTVSKLCELIYQFDDELGGAGTALKAAADIAESRGIKTVLCHTPLDPSRLDAVLLPEHSLAFVGGSWEIESARHIRIDKYIPPALRREHLAELRQGKRFEKRLVDLALDKLGKAKVLHDELETVYKRNMDFYALNEYTDAELKKYFPAG